jgi:hypothetical protein
MIGKDKSDMHTWQGIQILKADKGCQNYQAEINVYLAKRLCWWLNNSDLDTLLQPIPNEMNGAGAWVDLAGLPTPQNQLEVLLRDLELGKMDSIGTFESHLDELHANYVNYEWKYLKRLIQHQTGKAFTSLQKTELAELIERGLKSEQMLFQLRLDDASREFTPFMQTGSGLDGSSQERQTDFDVVAGKFETNSFLIEYRNSMEQFEQQAQKHIKLLRGQ